MSEVLQPNSADDVLEAVRWAGDTDTALSIAGHDSKKRLGNRCRADTMLDVSALSGVTFYEPDELVIRVGAGTSLKELHAVLSERNQHLACEVPLLAKLYKSDSFGTVGGAVAVGFAGPRRIRSGSLRDQVIGVRGVSGFGAAFKSGGRVVKNVSGYDLSKLMTGSFGTLGVLTEITLKVLPVYETSKTLFAKGLNIVDAVRNLRSLDQSPLEATGLAYLPATVAARSGIGEIADSGESALFVRLEGPEVSLSDRIETARGLVPALEHELDRETSEALWREIRDVSPLLCQPKPDALWRLTVPPASASTVINQNTDADYIFDWAGGLVWMWSAEPIAIPSLDEGDLHCLRVSADGDSCPPFLPRVSDIHRTMAERLKDAFDPKRILNPGRLYEGI